MHKKNVCLQDTIARARTRPKGLAAARPSARATIGFLVYKKNVGCWGDLINPFSTFIIDHLKMRYYITQ